MDHPADQTEIQSSSQNKKLLHSFDFLPELEDEIFEHAARMYLSYAPTLALVSKRVQKRVESVIYETIALGSRHSNSGTYGMSIVEKLEPTLHSRPAKFFALRVRNMCITDSVPREMTPFILSLCTGILHLAIWQRREPSYEVSRFILPLSSTLCSLDTDRFTIDRLAASGVVFPNLELLRILSWPSAAAVPSLQWLPALTRVFLDMTGSGHIPFFDGDWRKDVRTILSSAVLLHQVVLEGDFDSPEARTELAGLEDDKVVVKNRGPDNDYIGEPTRDYVREWEEFCGIFMTRPQFAGYPYDDLSDESTEYSDDD